MVLHADVVAKMAWGAACGRSTRTHTTHTHTRARAVPGPQLRLKDLGKIWPFNKMLPEILRGRANQEELHRWAGGPRSRLPSTHSELTALAQPLPLDGSVHPARAHHRPLRRIKSQHCIAIHRYKYHACVLRRAGTTASWRRCRTSCPTRRTSRSAASRPSSACSSSGACSRARSCRWPRCDHLCACVRVCVPPCAAVCVCRRVHVQPRAFLSVAKVQGWHGGGTHTAVVLSSSPPRAHIAPTPELPFLRLCVRS